MSKIPKVVIVGRMNVGKSTLFNRLSTDIKSLTLDYEGVTRDVISDRVVWQSRSFDLVDTGGITQKSTDPLSATVRERAYQYIDAADIILFVVDGSVGILSEDQEIAHTLRSRNKKVFLIINKSDTKSTEDYLLDFYQLYHNKIIKISAIHGLGIGELLEEIVNALPPETSESEEEKAAYRVTLIGRPNVGKSSLMNSLVQEERSIVSPLPGTTREAVSSQISFYRESLQLTDTPGIRKQKAIDEDIETLMVKSSLRAIKDAHVVLLIIDASEAGIVDQELKLAFYSFADLYKALIIVVNKIDLLDEEKQAALQAKFDEYPQLINKIKVIKISCKTGKNIGVVLPIIKEVWERHSQRLPAAELSRILIEAMDRVPLMRNKQRLQIKHVEQIAVTPITIKLRVNYPKFFETAQKNYLDNVLRKNFDLTGAPIKFVLV